MTVTCARPGPPVRGGRRPDVLRTEVGERPPPARPPGTGIRRRGGPRRSRGRRRRVPRARRRRRAPVARWRDPTDGRHRCGRRRLRPPDEPCTRSAPPYPPGDRQRGPGGRRPLVVGGHPSDLPAPPRARGRLPLLAPARTDGPDGRGLGAGAFGSVGRASVSTRCCSGCSPGVPPRSTSPASRDRVRSSSPGRRRAAFHADRPGKDARTDHGGARERVAPAGRGPRARPVRSRRRRRSGP